MITIQNLIELVDQLVFAHREKHLSDLEKEILQETLKGENYHHIASTTKYSVKYVRDKAGNLWKTLSEIFGEKITKVNVKSTIERAINHQNTETQIAPNINHNHFNRNPSLDPLNDQLVHYNSEDLDDAPKIDSFYGRTEELKLLKQKIFQENCNFVTILGIKGIGKTTLSLKLIEEIKPNFDYAIYKSLTSLPSLKQLIREIVQPDHAPTLSQLKKELKQHRYLIILDDIHLVFSPFQTARRYEKGYEAYSRLFKLLTETSHQGCIIFNTSEEIRELLEGFFLKLSGLGKAAIKILKSYKLTPTEDYENLINYYEQNPLYLKAISIFIRDLFGGNIKNFFGLEQPHIDYELKAILQDSLCRLSPAELQLLEIIASQDNRISIHQLHAQCSQFPHNLLMNTVQSLIKRLLLSSQLDDEQVYVKISPIIKHYLREQNSSMFPS